MYPNIYRCKPRTISSMQHKLNNINIGVRLCITMSFKSRDKTVQRATVSWEWEILPAILMKQLCAIHKMLFKNTDTHKDIEEIQAYLVISIVPADDLVLSEPGHLQAQWRPDLGFVYVRLPLIITNFYAIIHNTGTIPPKNWITSLISGGMHITERERLSLSAFLGTEDIGVHIVHISRVIITYTLE